MDQTRADGGLHNDASSRSNGSGRLRGGRRPARVQNTMLDCDCSTSCRRTEHLFGCVRASAGRARGSQVVKTRDQGKVRDLGSFSLRSRDEGAWGGRWWVINWKSRRRPPSSGGCQCALRESCMDSQLAVKRQLTGLRDGGRSRCPVYSPGSAQRINAWRPRQLR